jgi:hypothetical protein
MKELAKRFAALFAGNVRSHGRFELEEPVEGKTKRGGKARTIHHGATLKDYAKHLAGELGIGIVPVRDDDLCVFGALDIDDYSISAVEIAAAVKRLRLPLVVTVSKSGGAHVWLFCEPTPAKLVRLYLEDVGVCLGVHGCEIFPKQSSIKPHETGNWINLPYFGGTRLLFDDAPLEEFIARAEDCIPAQKFAARLKAKEEPSSDVERLPVHDGPPCLMRLLTAGVEEGTRNTTFFNLSIYMKKKHVEDWVEQGDALAWKHFESLPNAVERLNIEKQLNRKDVKFQCDVEPLKSNCQRAVCIASEFGVDATAPLTSKKALPPGTILLPGGSQSITVAAREVITTLQDEGDFIRRGDILFRADFETGATDLITPQALRSLIETVGVDGNGVRKIYRETTRGLKPVYKPDTAKIDDAQAIMASPPVKNLPNVKAISTSPILRPDGTIVYNGIENEVLITSGNSPFKPMKLTAAIRDILSLLRDYRFRSTGDKSRAVAAILTPELHVSNLIGGHSPITLLEANESQSGKTKLANIIFAIYGDFDPAVAVVKDASEGGVGGMTEALGAAFVHARNFVFIDNLRTDGPFQNAFLESAITNSAKVPIRLPYAKTTYIDISRISVVATANDLVINRDLANRANMIMLLKQPDGYKFHNWGDEIEVHVRNHREHYFNCVATILQHWITEHDSRASDEAGLQHDFRKWAAKMDYIVTKIMNLDPPFAEYRKVQEQKVDTDAQWLEKFAAAITAPDCTDEAHRWNALDGLGAKAIFQASERLGLKPPVDHFRSLGYILKRLTKDSPRAVIGSRFEIVTATTRDREKGRTVKTYYFTDFEAPSSEQGSPY